jgi:hypothetical protein
MLVRLLCRRVSAYQRVWQHCLDAFEDVRLDPKEALDLVRFESGSRQPTDHHTHLPTCCPELTPAGALCALVA